MKVRERMQTVPAIFMISSPEADNLAPNCNVAESHPDPALPVTHAPRLLLVEDDPRVGSFITQGLRDEGYEVAWAATADDALARALTGPFDLVLLDHMLPGRSGIEVARALRASGSTTPILMLTARDAPEDRRAAFAAGANEFVGKPFLFDDLLARIHALLIA